MLAYFLFAFLILGVGNLVLFDQLVRRQRRFHPEDWERSGRPWSGRTPGGSLAWQKCSLAWLFSTPAWIRNDKHAFRLLRFYRGCCWVGTAAVCVVLSHTVKALIPAISRLIH
jgi:hypothetical protein